MPPRRASAPGLACQLRGYARAGEVAPLDTDDLDALAFAAWRLGHAKESSRAAERVFAQLIRTDPVAAAMKANELALAWLVRGDLNIGQGWMNRARRLLAGAPESTPHGYLAYLDAAVAAVSQNLDALAVHVHGVAGAWAARLDVPAISALGARSPGGIEAILQARTAEGYAQIDEALLPLLADEVPIEWAGDIYCMVLHHCHKLADLPRMRAWTQSMERWCGVSGSLPYGGVCDVHRLQVRVATDDYRELRGPPRRMPATALEDVNIWAAAEGFYQLGEVRRLLGDHDGALAAFAKARELGMDPQPGEALLRCRQGDSQAAWTAIRVALAGEDRLVRIRLLRAAVEIALGRDSLDEAESYCRELESGAAAFDTPGFRAWAAHAGERCRCAGVSSRRHWRRCSRPCGNTGPSSRATRRPRSTSGWRWRIAGSVTTQSAAADAATADSHLCPARGRTGRHLRVDRARVA